MAVLRSVTTIPATRGLEGRWDADPALDAFLGASRSVFELFSEELAVEKVAAGRGRLEFYVQPTEHPFARVEVSSRFDSDIGAGNLYVPASFADLSAEERACGAMDVLEAALGELAQAHGWSQAALAAASGRVRQRGLTFTWQGPWKTAPGRRHQARGVYRIAPDGLGRAQLEIREVKTERLVVRTEEALAFTTLAGLKSSARSLTWSDSDCVHMLAWVDQNGQGSGRLEATPASGDICLESTPGFSYRKTLDVLSLARRPRELTTADAPRDPDLYLSYVGAVFWILGLSGYLQKRASAAMQTVVATANTNIDGQAWLAGSGFIGVEVQFIVSSRRTLLGGTDRIDTPEGPVLLTSIGITEEQVRLPDPQLTEELTRMLREHLILVTIRRKLSEPLWN